MAKRLIISGKSLQEKNYITVDFPEGSSARELIGSNPERNFKVVIHGRRKQGKSTLAMQFLKEFSFSGKALYVSYEQKFSMSLQSLVKRTFNNGPMKNVFFGHSLDLETLKQKIKRNHYRYIFIDSVQWAKFTQAQWTEFFDQYNHKSLILVSHDSVPIFLEHAVDVVIHVKEGLAVPAGRFGASEPFQIPGVFDHFAKMKKANKYDPQLKLL